MLFIALVLMLSSCASYNKQVGIYYTNLREGNYEKAAVSLDNNKLLKKDRNKLLYLLERGKVCHLLQQWDSSNNYFNEADLIMEVAGTSAKDIALGTLLNPMMQSYKGEDFEKYLVHYYKALNYLQLGNTEDALVEARRITLRTNTQEDKTGKNKYSEDAFSLMLQGMIYEKANDWNNAFIAYRNAADVFLEKDGSYYGTKMPDQLKKDLLRSAWQSGFTDELNRYEKLLNTSFSNETNSGGGEVILFWENGLAPVKQQEDIYFSLFKDAGGSFMFKDAGGLYSIPFDHRSGYNTNDIKLENLRSFRVALPRYEAQPLFYSGANLQLNNQHYSLEPAENINTLAFATLKERMLKELSSTLTRLAVKKFAEAALRPKEEKEDKNKTEEQKKKEQKEKAAREALALGMQIFNFATEKADTRNWQSLPHTIYYTRVPLQKGTNNITLQLTGPSSSAVQLLVEGNGGLQFQNVCTLR
ncbi:COG3014 family protein [Terrimonas alba]|uniref:COG3014 family protein n=1 Tax=Terrimonas alba TaxID=3349636 RepID=UPI0035F30736